MNIRRIVSSCVTALLFATSIASAQTVTVPSGELVSVMLLSDIGSRISSEGDRFAVVTVDDLYVRGKLVLPKGSPGYGEIMHIKRAGHFHAGAEFSFEVKRLVAPDGSDLHVDMLGGGGDARRYAERNGNAVGQYLLWGATLGLGAVAFGQRGNDILIKKNALFHLVTESTRDITVVKYGTRPVGLDAVLVSQEN